MSLKLVLIDEQSGRQLLCERDPRTIQLATAEILNVRKELVDTLAAVLGLESVPAKRRRRK